MKSYEFLIIKNPVKTDLNTTKKTSILRSFSRGREIRTPMSGFGDRHTAIV